MEAAAAGDTLQAVADTMIVAQQSDTALDWLSFIGTALVAGFTGGYLYYTYCIYQETQKQTRSAEASAEASQKAAQASQDSLEEQKQVNEATIDALEKRSVERAHPLLWIDLDLTEDDRGKWVQVDLHNQSDLPALDVSVFVIADYPRDYCAWMEFRAEADEVTRDFFGEDPHEYHFLTTIDIEALASGTDPSMRLKYPVPPASIGVLLQYRDIHGDNYGRHFWASGVYDASVSDHLTPASIVSYSHSKTSPHSVEKSNRIDDWKVREDDSVRPILLREEDRTTRDTIKMAQEYRHSEDELIERVGKMNGDLKTAIKTDSLRPFDAKVEEQGLFSYSVSVPLSRFQSQGTSHSDSSD